MSRGGVRGSADLLLCSVIDFFINNCRNNIFVNDPTMPVFSDVNTIRQQIA